MDEPLTGRLMSHRILPVVFALVFWLPSQVRTQNILRETLRDFRIDDSWIYDDWDAARELAAREGKPIFAVFRCVP